MSSCLIGTMGTGLARSVACANRMSSASEIPFRKRGETRMPLAHRRLDVLSLADETCSIHGRVRVPYLRESFQAAVFVRCLWLPARP